MDFTGVALGSGVNQYMKMDEMARANKKLEMEKALADQQLAKGQMDLDRLKRIDEAGRLRASRVKAFDSGDYGHQDVQGLLNNFNGNKPPFNNGYTAEPVLGANGALTHMRFKDADGNVVSTQPFGRKEYMQAVDADYMAAAMSPELMMKSRELDQGDEKNRITSRHVDDQGRLIDAQSLYYGAQARNVGAPSPMNPLQAYQLQQQKAYDAEKTAIGQALQAGTITQQEAEKRLNFAGMKFGGHLPAGKSQIDGPEVKYTTQDGIELKGTQDHIHNWRLENEPTYRAARGIGNNGLSMADPRQPKQGTGLQRSKTAAPVRQSGVADADLNVMISDAARGGQTGRAYLQQALQSGELNIRQRQAVEAALGGR